MPDQRRDRIGSGRQVEHGQGRYSHAEIVAQGRLARVAGLDDVQLRGRRQAQRQFEGAGAPKKSERTINGFKVHLVAVSGTYLSPAGPMMQSQGKKPGWSLSGAIVEAPEGNVFFKCVGPAATIQKAQPEIDELLKSLTKAGAAKA